MAHALYKGIGSLALIGAVVTAPTWPAYRLPTPAQSLDDRIEHIPYERYKVASQSRQIVAVMYISTESNRYAEPETARESGDRGTRLLNWLARTYGSSIDRFVIVDLPESSVGAKILEQETGLLRVPSLVVYRAGRPMLRVRGPPTAADVASDYPGIRRVMRRAGFWPDYPQKR